MSWMNHVLVEQIGLTLMHFLWQGAIIGLLYAATLPLTRNASARTRYTLAVSTLLLLAAAPAVTLAVLAGPGTHTGPAAGALEPAMLVLGVGAEGATGGQALMGWIVAAWLLGVLVLSLRLILGWQFLRRLRRQADHAAAAPLAQMLQRLLERLDIRRPVAVAVSRGIRSPVVIGWLKPLVLLPPAIAAGLPARQLEMVLAHELAHVRRFDHLINLFQTVVETVLFYHPVVRWVSRRIRVERENACDDLAVAVTADRLAYVEMLASLEKLRYEGPRLALAMHDGQVLSRIRRLVEQGRPGRQLGLTVPALLAGLLLAAAGSLQLIPQEIDQEPAPFDDASSIASATPLEVEAAADPGPEPDPVEMAIPPEAAAPGATSQADDRSSTRPAESIAGAGRAEPGAAESPAPALPRPETDRLPPAASLLTEPESELAQLAMLDRPALALPQLPEPTPAPSPATSGPVISGGSLIERVEPEYPIRARQRGIDGRVEVEFLVTVDGKVSDLEVLKEQPGGLSFAEAARAAISQWSFEPYRQDGSPIDRRVRLEVEFNVDQLIDCSPQLGSRIPRC